MPPGVAMIEVLNGAVLPVRIFINRKELLRNIGDSKTVFETPVLSNNSIIRLKSPLVKLYLSNNDTRSLCNEIKDDLLLILFYLTAKEVQEGALSKLRVGNTIEFKDAFANVPISVARSSKRSTSTPGEETDSLYTHITTIERIGKYQYKLHFTKSWELDIFIKDIRKLAIIRNSLLLKTSMNTFIPSQPRSTPLGDLGSMKILKRERFEKKAAKEDKNPPVMLLESDDENGVPESLSTAETSEPTQDIDGEKAETGTEKKPLFEYGYEPMTNYGKCIEIHVLKRPRRNATASD